MIVGWLSNFTKSQWIFSFSSNAVNADPASSFPVKPNNCTGTLSEAIFIATFAAPPARSSFSCTRTTGTGASGEIRFVAPNQ